MAPVKQLLDNPDVRKSFQKRIFRLFDVDQDGELHFLEAHHLVQYLCESIQVESPDQQKVKAVFKTCDVSRSGGLSVAEFDAFFEKLLARIDREGGGDKSLRAPEQDQMDDGVDTEDLIQQSSMSSLVEAIRPYTVKRGFSSLMKPKCKELYDEICSSGQEEMEMQSSRSDVSEMSYQQMQGFFDKLGVYFFNRPISELLNYDIFERYDFNGNATVGFTEAFRCVKHCLIAAYKQHGGDPMTQVDFKTPEEAGYKKIKMLASGGQGSAWLATSTTRGQVALKVYNKGNPNALHIEELVEEMEVMKHLEKSPFIVREMEIFQDANCLYSVSELLLGGDFTKLRKNVKAAGVSLTESYFKKLFKQCVLAVAFLHKKAIMHCDIKEANIMIRNMDYRRPHVVLIDFGMATLAAGQGMRGGTPGYRPPETNKSNKWYPAGDIFSLGVTFFQVMADRVPDDEVGIRGVFHEGAQTIEDVYNFTATRAIPLSVLGAQYPSAMHWLMKMTEKQRWRRPRAPQLLLMQWFSVDVTLPKASSACVPPNIRGSSACAPPNKGSSACVPPSCRGSSACAPPNSNVSSVATKAATLLTPSVIAASTSQQDAPAITKNGSLHLPKTVSRLAPAPSRTSLGSPHQECESPKSPLRHGSPGRPCESPKSPLRHGSPVRPNVPVWSAMNISFSLEPRKVPELPFCPGVLNGPNERVLNPRGIANVAADGNIRSRALSADSNPSNGQAHLASPIGTARSISPSKAQVPVVPFAGTTHSIRPFGTQVHLASPRATTRSGSFNAQAPVASPRMGSRCGVHAQVGALPAPTYSSRRGSPASSTAGGTKQPSIARAAKSVDALPAPTYSPRRGSPAPSIASGTKQPSIARAAKSVDAVPAPTYSPRRGSPAPSIAGGTKQPSIARAAKSVDALPAPTYSPRRGSPAPSIAGGTKQPSIARVAKSVL